MAKRSGLEALKLNWLSSAMCDNGNFFVAKVRHALMSAAFVSAPSNTNSEGDCHQRAGFAAGPVYSSSATWKLVPPKPNELMEARRG